MPSSSAAFDKIGRKGESKIEKLLLAAEIASCMSAIAGALILFIKPLREKVLGTKKQKEGEKCLLRSDMLKTYYHNVDKQKIRQFELENFVLEYEAYKALGGNSFIDIIYEEVISWEVLS